MTDPMQPPTGGALDASPTPTPTNERQDVRGVLLALLDDVEIAANNATITLDLKRVMGRISTLRAAVKAAPLAAVSAAAPASSSLVREAEMLTDRAYAAGFSPAHVAAFAEAVLPYLRTAAAAPDDRPAPVVSGECDHAKAAREIARVTPLSLDAATALIDSLARGAATLADAWDEGYGAAETKARMWGHTDHWETGPENPYRTVRRALPEGAHAATWPGGGCQCFCAIGHDHDADDEGGQE